MYLGKFTRFNLHSNIFKLILRLACEGYIYESDLHSNIFKLIFPFQNNIHLY